MTFEQSMGRLLERFKSKANIARALGVSRQSVQAWEYKSRIPNSAAIQIEKITDGEIKAVDLV